MTDVENAPLRRDRTRPPAGRPRRRTSVLGVIGELFITVGLIALLYVAWQMWIGDLIYGAEASAEAQSLSEQWQQDYEQSAPASPSPSETAEAPVTTVDPIVLPTAADAETFATMYVPRFGSDYAYEVAGGVTRERTLDTVRIGHYSDTPMPGAVGNVSLAAHRTTYGKPFNQIADLHVGDAIVIEVEEGWYTYRFRTLEYVTPDSSDVLLPVPQQEGVEANGRYLTMTSCSPMYNLTERIIAYSVFESFTPRSAGEPAALTEGLS
ncbi:sortase A [Microbacterium halimionae]|uniref:Sortase A n=1 Tax=Microbacterium halimionae TaxID=1526413 RepID=A0A7W3PMM8_9MICO|nr:class E sortase [Microbacterium halimionae]MBA8817094.1 sortase A [Microbacterium halimionae]NII94366.1 sortase A [Microbacterium halimionae]